MDLVHSYEDQVLLFALKKHVAWLKHTKKNYYLGAISVIQDGY